MCARVCVCTLSFIFFVSVSVFHPSPRSFSLIVFLESAVKHGTSHTRKRHHRVISASTRRRGKAGKSQCRNENHVCVRRRVSLFCSLKKRVPLFFLLLCTQRPLHGVCACGYPLSACRGSARGRTSQRSMPSSAVSRRLATPNKVNKKTTEEPTR